MAEFDDILSDRLDRLENIPDRYMGKIADIQPMVYAEFLAILNELGFNDGAVELNAANLARIDSMMGKYERELLNGRYGALVNGYMKQLEDQKELIGAMYLLDSGVAQTNASDLVFAQSRQEALRILTGDEFKTNFINVIRDELVRNVEAQATFDELRLNMRDVILGNDGRKPRMVGWTNQVANDIFATTDRKYSSTIATDLGLEFGTYAGIIIQDSRPFCIERVGKYFHIEEVRSWASQEWKGKFRNTTPENIVMWLGGYNCKHTFVFRSLINVPIVDLNRARSAGYWEPTPREIELLGLAA